WESLQKMPHRGWQAADEAREAHRRLRERAALRVGQHDGEVIAVAHQRGEAGADEGGRRLVHDADEALPENLQLDRIEPSIANERLVDGEAQMGGGAFHVSRIP